MQTPYSPPSKGQSPNHDLIGVAGSAHMLDTPALVIDVDILEANIAAMADWAARNGLGLRPHAKTHKSVEIAKRQLDAGALGICVAKIGEALRMVEGGIDRLLITSPIVTPRKIRLLKDINERCAELMVVVDHPDIVPRLDDAFDGTKGLQVLIDQGMGIGYHNRTGVFTAQAAVALANVISGSRNLTLRGVQAYSGAVQHVEDLEQRRLMAADAIERVRRTRDALVEAGHRVDIVTGGGTGSCEFDVTSGVFNELQVGSYVFLDVEYNGVRHGSNFPHLATSLFVQATVISANLFGRATTDAGLKAFATDGPLPGIHAGAERDSSYVFMGDEQGGIIAAEGKAGLTRGDVVRCVTPHCDPSVNLYDFYHCIKGGTLIDIWPVDARGHSW